MDEKTLLKEDLAKRIAGEIVLSPEPGKTIQKWRNIFKVSQRKLADEMGVMPSVISDYESGRRKSPGIGVVRKIVDTLIRIDEKTGGTVARYFSAFPGSGFLTEIVIDIKEFDRPVTVKKFCETLPARLETCRDLGSHPIYGYTVIDSIKAILDLQPQDLVKLYGFTSERALIFTALKRGRSPLVAIKVTNLRPGLIVLQGVEAVDELARRISEAERIPVAVTRTGVDEMIENLRKLSTTNNINQLREE